VPCYNEHARLPVDGFIDHLKLHPHHACCFVDDGSTDGTIELLRRITNECSNAFVLERGSNGGKANAVYDGILHAFKNIPAHYFGYMDADLATPLSFISIMEAEIQKDPEYFMLFGSRQIAEQNAVERKAFRHYSGRFVSSIITWSLGVKFGDTQCGAKLLSKKGVEIGFEGPFSSSWVFDVEVIKRILLNIGKENSSRHILEIPVNQWKDVGNSKVSTLYVFKMIGELMRIRRMR
jgi:dolichyl-phosphate beta-glucosyltransferase